MAKIQLLLLPLSFLILFGGCPGGGLPDAGTTDAGNGDGDGDGDTGDGDGDGDTGDGDGDGDTGDGDGDGDGDTGDGDGDGDGDSVAPTVLSTFPDEGAQGGPRNVTITATFSEAIDPDTINDSTFLLMDGAVEIDAIVSYAGTTATLNPTAILSANTPYTVEITTAVTDLAGNALVAPEVWGFTTVDTGPNGPPSVNLGTAQSYVLLAKAAISTTGTTSVVGDIGISPAAASFITEFGLSAPPSTFSTSPLVTGQVLASDYDAPTPANLTAAVLDMEAAYTDAAGRVLPDFTELGAGDVDGMTLTPGLYKWGTGLAFANGLTLNGGPNDVWIFQIGGDLTVGNGAILYLSGGALPENIFWQVAGQANFGTTSAFHGVVLCQTLISFNTGAALTGRALAQTAITLNATAITSP